MLQARQHVCCLARYVRGAFAASGAWAAWHAWRALTRAPAQEHQHACTGTQVCHAGFSTADGVPAVLALWRCCKVQTALLRSPRQRGCNAALVTCS